MNSPSWQRLPKHTAATPARDIRRWGFGLGGTLILLGLLVLALAGGDVLRRATRGAHRLTLPGSRTLKLSEGVHVGMAEPGRKAAAPPSLSVTVQETRTGLPVPVLAAASFGTAPGTPAPLFQFQILDEGEYLISGVVGSGEDGERGFPILVVHESLATNRSDLAVGVVTCLLLAAGGIAIIIAVRRRSRS